MNQNKGRTFWYARHDDGKWYLEDGKESALLDCSESMELAYQKGKDEGYADGYSDGKYHSGDDV